MLGGVMWGDLPGWVGAFGTLGAFFTGGWLLLREIQRGHRLEDERRRDQASRLWAWIDLVTVEEVFDEPDPTLAAVGLGVRVRNGSDLPIYDCLVMFIDRTTGTHLGTEDVGLVLPGETEARFVPERVLNEVESPARYELKVDAFFFDTARRRWHRSSRGDLRELPVTLGSDVAPPRLPRRSRRRSGGDSRSRAS